jgi:hypothetical protein
VHRSSAPAEARPNLKDDERRVIFERLLEMSVNGNLPRGAIAQLAPEKSRDRATITRIWKRGMDSRRHGLAAADVASKIKGIDFKRLL